ncbi:dynein light chain Tctex-type protein 2B-like [Dysidea avara]|uniref:dynein light chain Tctex-type protein 2B-like n=1 Tax=Dysidea avara TaxID=196820 RepID=UPI0033276A20
MEAEEEPAANTYIIRPNFKHKFKPAVVKDAIHQILQERLHEKQYSSDQANVWSKEISNAITQRLKELQFERYKFVVQVVIGEQRGEGVKMTCRCLWDSDTDSYAQDIFMNDSLFCVAAAYGVFFY